MGTAMLLTLTVASRSHQTQGRWNHEWSFLFLKPCPHPVTTKYSSTIFFTSHSLLVSLHELGFRATGTIRENRLSGCPLPTKKKTEQQKRGEFCFCFDPENEVLFVKWKGNSIVTMATNYDTVKPLCSVSRWSSSEKKKVKARATATPVQQLQQRHGRR